MHVFIHKLSGFPLSGKKPDGTPKIRAVDDLSRSGINDATAPAEHPVCDTIDTLRNSMRALRVARSKKVVMYQYVSGKCLLHGALQAPERIMHTFKADIDSAFRRIPIMPGGQPSLYLSPYNNSLFCAGHRQFAGVAYKKGDDIWTSQHYSMPFGAVSSVHAWDRVGAFFRALGRRLFHLILFRYVDDFFAPDWADVIQNAKEVFAELVRACLGTDALSAHKLEAGNGLTILGVVVVASLYCVVMWPSPDKVKKWSERIGQLWKAVR